MASDRWKESGEHDGSSDEPREPDPSAGAIPEFVRRALSAGFSGFFLTGEALREALGDSLPREWADFASEQSARARREFVERLSTEMGRAVENIDWSEVISKLLEGRSIEVHARIRLGDDRNAAKSSLRIELDDD